MNKLNSGEVYEKILVGNLQRVLDFQKFAEAKNAALLALSSAWVVAIINLVCSEKPIPPALSPFILATLFLGLCAASLAMLSFLPRLHLPKFLGGKAAGPFSKNLLYFGDMSSLTAKELERDLHANYFPDAKGHTNSYVHDLIVQISVNSKITMRKMLLFRSGITLILIAAILLFIPVGRLALKSIGIT